MDKYTAKVNNFCKSTRIRDKKLEEIYNRFIGKNPDLTDQWKFEKAMLSLRKSPAIVCRENCISYAKEKGLHSWAEFAKEIDNITADFWSAAVGVEVIPEAPKTKRLSDEVAYEKLLPRNWGIMTYSERIDFTLKVQHEGFLNYILNSDKKLKGYFSNLKEKKDSRLKLYITLFSINSDEYTEESKKLLKDFVKSLNKLGRAKLQVIECTDPNVLEVREIR